MRRKTQTRAALDVVRDVPREVVRDVVRDVVRGARHNIIKTAVRGAYRGMILLTVTAVFSGVFLSIFSGGATPVRAGALTDIRLLADNASFGLFMPSGAGIAESRGVLVADTYNRRILLIDSAGASVFSRASYSMPADVAAARNGTVFVADTGDNTIKRIRAGFTDTVVKSGTLNSPQSVVCDTDGNLYIADTLNHCIRLLDANGRLTVFAGRIGISGNKDGTLAEASFFEPSGLALDKNGALYVADSANHAIRKIENGTVATLAGTRGAQDRETGYYAGGCQDGTAPLFNFPKGVAVSSDGTQIFVADTFNNAVRLLRKTDGGYEAVTLLGGGESGRLYSNTKNAGLSRPRDVCLAGETLYVTDSLNDAAIAVSLSNGLLAGVPNRDVLARQSNVTGYQSKLTLFIDGKISRIAPVLTKDSFTLPMNEFLTEIGASGIMSGGKTLSLTINGEKAVLNEGVHFKSGAVNVSAVMEALPVICRWYPEFNALVVMTGR